MDKQWLDKNASYMDFNVNSCLLTSHPQLEPKSTCLMFVMPLVGGTEVNTNPAGEGAHAGRCDADRRHAIIQPALLVTKIPNA
jgi:hypothetical protein